MHRKTYSCEMCRLQPGGRSRHDAIKSLVAHDAELIERVGWVAHAMTDRPLIHTHGLQERFDHPDLEIRLAVPPEKRYHLLAPIAEAVKAGRRFQVGGEDPTLFSVPIRFIAREESGRMVLRAIFPDPAGRFPDDPGCPPEWAEQVLQDR